MECSDDAWLMSITLIWCCARILNIRAETPATPTIPLPSIFIRQISLSEEIPFIKPLPLPDSLQIKVPLWAGLNVFFTSIGISFAIAGCIVAGNITLAPKWVISIASLYESCSMLCASLTNRGSAVITPSTSVHISIASALSAAPNIEAV